MMQTIDQPLMVKKSWKQKLFDWLRLTNQPAIKLYHGYGHNNKLTIYGHVLKTGPVPKKHYRKSFIRNTLALLRLFCVEPFAGVTVRLQWKDQTCNAITDSDGFFKIEWSDNTLDKQGWFEVMVRAYYNGEEVDAEKGKVFIPYETQYGFISDIDDTFLVSHSANLRKRLMVLFTQNARTRQPFEGVVKHSQLLALSNTTPDAPNPFFYVSSSEWNLYEYILEFARTNKMPEGVFLLNQLKTLSQIFKTGQNNHTTKFTRIVRILENYPDQRFVLLGDSSQQDPYIYASVVEHFPKRIAAVYIRNVHEPNYKKVSEVITKIEGAGVPCCFFRHSADAILHSRKIGLVAAEDVNESV
jgi:phosphatidate phosphatase APP1